MDNNENLVLLENDGVYGKYLCPQSNSVIEAIGTVAVISDKKMSKYKGIVIWSDEYSILEQVNMAKKICGKYCDISNKNLLGMAREKKLDIW